MVNSCCSKLRSGAPWKFAKGGASAFPCDMDSSFIFLRDGAKTENKGEQNSPSSPEPRALAVTGYGLRFAVGADCGAGKVSASALVERGFSPGWLKNMLREGRGRPGPSPVRPPARPWPAPGPFPGPPPGPSPRSSRKRCAGPGSSAARAHVNGGMAAHRAGPLKQQNKAHKGGRHRGRGSAQRDNKGEET